MPLPIGMTYCFREGKNKPVVLRSHAIKVYMERDGMTEEEAFEMWDYNMAGSDSMLIAVDDMMTPNEISIAYAEENGVELTEDECEWDESAKEAAKIQNINLDD